MEEMKSAIKELNDDLKRIKENPIDFFSARLFAERKYINFLTCFGLKKDDVDWDLTAMYCDVAKPGRPGELPQRKANWVWFEKLCDLEFMTDYITHCLENKSEDEIEKGLQKWNCKNQKLNEKGN